MNKTILVTGSRQASGRMLAQARRLVERARQSANQVTFLVGDAPGVDAAVIQACDELGVPVVVYGANCTFRHYTRTGRNLPVGGSYITRDRVMAEACDECFAIWNGHSRGTRLTFQEVIRLGKPVKIYRPDWGRWQ